MMKYKKLEKGVICEVTWRDHFGSKGESIKDALGHSECILKTTGKYLGASTDKNYIIIAPEIDEDESCNNEYTHIMINCVTNIRVLK